MEGSDTAARLPDDVPADYQLGGDYPPTDQVVVVVRDWFEGEPLADGYSICYVNAFQTQDDEDGFDRPDERSNWPEELVLTDLGDDPNWGGEYLVDISTEELRTAAAAWVEPMLAQCADDGFDAVELDNLDSWTRFDGTPIAEQVPFGQDDAVAYATALVDVAHDLGLAAAQKNTLELTAEEVDAIGFDFLIIEECGLHDECDEAVAAYGEQVVAVEYDDASFAAACDAIGDDVSVVRRDLELSGPGSATYTYDEC